MSHSEPIKDYALDIGYHAVGIAPAEPFTQFAEALRERAENYTWAASRDRKSVV